MSEIKSVNKQTISAPVAGSASGSAVEKAKRVKFAALIKRDDIQASLNGTLGDAMRTKSFTASVISAVSTNPQLAECNGMTIISAALLGETLNLSPSPQLGQYYMVPFKDGKTGETKATFQLGWKGYYQLALRSGQYRNIDAVAIKEGELKKYNPITGEIQLDPIEDPLEREQAKTIGYYAWFETVNGFKKAMYWPREKMEAHATKYSKGYSAHKGYTFWEKDFDAMAVKTMYRQLIGKYGIMSIDMQTAYANDMTIQPSITKKEDDTPSFFDRPGVMDVDPDTGEILGGTE